MKSAVTDMNAIAGIHLMFAGDMGLAWLLVLPDIVLLGLEH